ncbi:hypothetical protein [Rhizorhabdus argentea]
MRRILVAKAAGGCLAVILFPVADILLVVLLKSPFFSWSAIH